MDIVLLKKIGDSEHITKRLSGVSGPIPRFLEVINLPEEERELDAPDGFIVAAVTYDLINNELIPTVHCNVFLGEDSIPDVIEDTRRYVVKRKSLKN
ncbi:hypothetical protein [Marinomonas aquiplantarum]|uniref:Uncharacterized protein n=1 Tax=Marinomonas aquiplantarum TaxID=491951 RepID=A0A366CY58_9GAMM|nr:hypothetical protein [Marinomonas aquiplantarum]RBO82596.1 hypothetical protein DFP76_10560 [Marinomonas aquiplantarum]